MNVRSCISLLSLAAAAGCSTNAAHPDAQAAADADPRCTTLAPLALVDPRVMPEAPAAGGTAKVQITLYNPGVAYRFYPGARLTSATAGVSVPVPVQGLALLDMGQRRPLTWDVQLAASLAPGTWVQLTARVVGAGRADCPEAAVLAHSFTLAER